MTTRSRPGRGQIFEAEAKNFGLEALWPRGLNITAMFCGYSDHWRRVDCIVGRSATRGPEAVISRSLGGRLLMPMMMKMMRRSQRRLCSMEPSTSLCSLCRWHCVWWLLWQPSAPYPSTLSDTDTCKHCVLVVLALWRPLLLYGYSYKASCARPG